MSDTTPRVVMGQSGARRAHKWRFVLLVVVVIVLAGGVGAGVRKWQHERAEARARKLHSALTQSFDSVLDGDYNNAHNTINKALQDSALSADAQYQLYMSQGSVYENQNDYDNALKSYQKAESIKPTYSSAESIAGVAERKGDKTLAITYYKKAISLVPDDLSTRDNTIQTYKDAIGRLGGRP